MPKWFLIAVTCAALAGCVTEQTPMLPMALAPSEAAAARCLTYADTPAFDCKTQASAESGQN